MARPPKFSKETVRRVNPGVAPSVVADIGTLATEAKHELGEVAAVESFERPYVDRHQSRMRLALAINEMAYPQVVMKVQANVQL